MVRIEKGRLADVPLDGLRAALLYAWVGAVFEGGGAMQVVPTSVSAPGSARPWRRPTWRGDR